MTATDDLIATAETATGALTRAVEAAAELAYTEITKPGIYEMSEPVYLADPVPGGSLSSSGAVKLLPPSCPAIYRWERDHPEPSSEAQTFGSATHKVLLGEGPELFVYEPIDGRTTAGKALAKDIQQAIAAGLIPVRTADHKKATAMADALRRVPAATALFDPATGAAEQSAFWSDPETGVWCRSRYDFLPHTRGGRLIFPDYKTAAAVDDDAINKAVAKWRYHQKLDFYERGAVTLGLADIVSGVLVVQMKTPPHLVRIVQPDEEARGIARRRNRRAIDLYAECHATGRWPGFGDDVYSAALPAWELYQEQED